MIATRLTQSTLAGLTVAAALAATASSALAYVQHYRAVLNSASVVPAPANQNPPRTASAGNGTADITYDTATKVLSWNLTYAGLTGPATSVKFHDPAALDQSGPPTVVVNGDMTSPIKGSSLDADGTPLTDTQAADLQTGKMYLDIATSAQPLGEVRGQLVKQ